MSNKIVDTYYVVTLGVQPNGIGYVNEVPHFFRSQSSASKYYDSIVLGNTGPHTIHSKKFEKRVFEIIDIDKLPSDVDFYLQNLTFRNDLPDKIMEDEK